MSTTADGALAAVKSRLTSGSITVTMYWHGDDPPILPDTPAAFAYIVFNNNGSGKYPDAYGGGQGNNLYRNQASVDAYVFAPKTGADGMAPVMAIAETIAARLRSFRDGSISVFSADVEPVGPGSEISPPGLQSEVNNYLCAIVSARLHFDLIG